MSSQIDCSIVLPVYNESLSILPFLEELYLHIDSIRHDTGTTFEVIAVNDASTDNSEQLLLDISTKYPSLRIFTFSQNNGHQAAILCGLKHARGSTIITMDSDGQDPPSSIRDLLNLHRDHNYPIIVAQRLSRRDSFMKRLSAWIFYRVLIILGLPKESQDAGDFRLVTSHIRDLIIAQPNSLQFLRGQLFTLKTPVYLLPIHRRQRISGSTSYTLRKMTRLAVSSLYVLDPIRFVQLLVLISLGCIAVSLISSLTVVSLKIFLPSYYVSGVTTVLLFLLFGFTFLVCMTSLTAAYSAFIFKTLRNDPPYTETELTS